MKKLMMAVAIVCAAVGVQAAQVDWTFETDDAMGDYVVADAATYYMIAGDTGVGATLAGILEANGVDAFTTALVDYKYNTGALVAGSTGKRIEDLGASDTYAAIFIFNDGVTAGSQFAYNEYDISDYIYTPPTAGDVLQGYASDFGDSDYASAWGTGTVAAVPEPTSALMLLVGLAGLALKRKVA